MSTSKIPIPANFDLQGHRGARGLMPENTIIGMEKALDLNVSSLEMDVVITGDEKVVVSHEAYFSSEISRHPNGQNVTVLEEESLNIYKMPYSEVAKFDVGSRGNSNFSKQEKVAAVKPLLSELVSVTEKYQSRLKQAPVQYNIEIKSSLEGDNIFHPTPAKFAEKVIEVLKEQGVLDRVIIESFDVRPLQYILQHYPEVKLSLIIDKSDKRLLQEQLAGLGFSPQIYSPHFSIVTPELVKNCKQLKLKIIPWTVNDGGEAKRLIRLGVDGLITDYPDIFSRRPD